MSVQDEQLVMFVANELVRMIRAERWTVADVLHLIVLFRKITEIEVCGGSDCERLKFYLNLPLHHRMDRKQAQDFLDEIEGSIETFRQAGEAGHPKSQDAETRLGSLVSFSEFRSLLIELLSQKRLLPKFFTDEQRWVRFVVGYVESIGESGVTIINEKDKSALVEARVSAPSVDARQITISWEWTLKMRNGDIAYLIPRLDLTKLVETTEVRVLHSGLEAADTTAPD